VSEVYKWKDAEKELKKAAAKLGCDAVYIINQNAKSEGVMYPVYGVGTMGAMDTQLIVTGVAIKYKD